jgi:hypothetical protein
MSLLVPVVGLTAAWLFFGETPGIAELLGAAVVIAGCALGVMGTGRSPRPTADRVAVSGVSGWRRHALVSPDPS